MLAIKLNFYKGTFISLLIIAYLNILCSSRKHENDDCKKIKMAIKISQDFFARNYEKFDSLVLELRKNETIRQAVVPYSYTIKNFHDFKINSLMQDLEVDSINQFGGICNRGVPQFFFSSMKHKEIGIYFFRNDCDSIISKYGNITRTINNSDLIGLGNFWYICISSCKDSILSNEKIEKEDLIINGSN